LKQQIAIFLFAIFLIGNSPCKEVLKLPLLVQHFAEHQQQHPNLTFLQFLQMHYLHDNANVADHDTDLKLPFKTMDVSSNPLEYFTNEMHYFIKQSIIPACTNVSHSSNYTCLIFNIYLHSIWQPPRSIAVQYCNV
jgi:hypothetical protein